ncbi:hypothetical protein FIBSPDRAFT_886304 [Athelia psychrophila]|uniref:Uncharacterized protein n=1 Tax=Athelia psychrophila TaxID=1759441 RepID=A0A166QZY9_9AGAM|nr:hypothetical protein FIBSPDRAFT_886304 [Fibularhizoctonia sp. CBS 109695]
MDSIPCILCGTFPSTFFDDYKQTFERDLDIVSLAAQHTLASIALTEVSANYEEFFYIPPTSEDTDTMIEQQVTPLRLDTEEKEQRDRLETDFHASQNTVTIYPKILWCITDRAQSVLVILLRYWLNLFAILHSVAKIEALALVGADMFTLHTTHSKVNRDGTEGCHDSPVTQPKYRLPQEGAPPSKDVYGRQHVLPKWVVKSENLNFLEALRVHMTYVKCLAIKNADADRILQAAKSYLETFKRNHRDQSRQAFPKDWVFREDPNAAARDYAVLDNRPRIHSELCLLGGSDHPAGKWCDQAAGRMAVVVSRARV